ncbi:MAG: hypothetical protein KKH68_12215 [Proteobacteria bacterium]|nr:hypothetical protein [Pseudomonadota bacterium]
MRTLAVVLTINLESYAKTFYCPGNHLPEKYQDRPLYACLIGIDAAMRF